MKNETNVVADDRKPWVKPEVTLIEAGSAEAGGQRQTDEGAAQS